MKSFLSRHIPVFYWATSILKDLLHNCRRDFGANYSIGGLKFAETTYLVTGSNGGIGQQICNILRTDDKVNIICQTRPQNRNTSDFNNNCYTFIDFQHINSILNILERSDINRIGHIVHVAGLMSRNERLSIMHSVNCISPFGLTLLLIPSLLLSNPFPVITFVSSSSHIRSSEYQKGDFQRYFSHPTADLTSTATTLGAYAKSKYNLLLLSAALEQKLSNTGLVIRNVHPGLVDTPMLRGFYFSNRYSDKPDTRIASAKNNAWSSICSSSSVVFDKVLERIRRRLLLSPQEGAINVLRAAFHQSNPPGKWKEENDHTISYFVNGIPAPDRLAYSLQHQEMDKIVTETEGRSNSNSKLSEQIQNCFEDAVRVLPTSFRRSVVHRLQTAASSPSPQMDPRQQERRIEAMLKLAEEINAICDDIHE